MKNKKFNLSENIWETEMPKGQMIFAKDVTEFIKRLKQRIYSDDFLLAKDNPRYEDWIMGELDKIAGDKLL